MGKTINCDYCNNNLSEPVNFYSDCLKLSCIKRCMDSGPVMDIYIEPTLKNEMYFCGLNCLNRWINEMSSGFTNKFKENSLSNEEKK